MSKQDDGGAAFPSIDGLSEDRHSGYTTYGDGGMSLRDYFAAQVMSFVLSQDERGYEKRCAVRAYRIADIMIAERTK